MLTVTICSTVVLFLKESAPSTEMHVFPTITVMQANYNSTYPYGDNPGGPIVRSMPLNVGTLGHNRWGLYDMHGNAEEWCADAWGIGTYSQGMVIDPIVLPKADHTKCQRVQRGGHFSSPPWNVRSASRTGSFARYPGGFRLVSPLPERGK